MRMLYKDNPRLVSQGGLFTRSPDGIDIEDWIKNNYNGPGSQVWLIILFLPNHGRKAILRALNQMNINHQSLFPDLYGATEFVNSKLALDPY